MAPLALDGVVGSSEALAAVSREVSLVAPLDIKVPLLGESGTGKSQIARIIHSNGRRAHGPLVELNCAANGLERRSRFAPTRPGALVRL